MATTDWLKSLTGSKRDAAAALIDLFKQFDLESLAPQIIKMIQEGESPDTITLRLQETPEYKQRFAGNADRIKSGLPVLTPAEYISVERSYRQILASSGLPAGFYDSNDDFRKFIANDMAPTELKGRVDQAFDLINNADPETISYFKNHYSTGEIAAYFLDPKKAQPLIDQAYRASRIGGAAARNGVNGVDAEAIAKLGVTAQQGDQGFAQIGQDLPTLSKLSDIYNGNLTTQDVVNTVFQGDAEGAKKIKKLASAERAAFSGSGGTSKTSLGGTGGGSI